MVDCMAQSWYMIGDETKRAYSGKKNSTGAVEHPQLKYKSCVSQ